MQQSGWFGWFGDLHLTKMSRIEMICNDAIGVFILENSVYRGYDPLASTSSAECLEGSATNCSWTFLLLSTIDKLHLFMRNQRTSA